MQPDHPLPQVTVGEIDDSQRIGVKGAGAARLLQSLGVDVPDHPNRYTSSGHASGQSPVLCLRLGQAEFLIEQQRPSSLIDELTARTSIEARVCAVLRCDRSFLVQGPDQDLLLQQLAAFDFHCLGETPDTVVMTLMADIPVTLIRERQADEPSTRIWCDRGFSDYLLDCLRTLARPSLLHGHDSQGHPA